MLLRWAIWLHKWVALIVGLQIIFWVVGGLVMVAIPIETVRGEQHIAPSRPTGLDRTKLLTLDQVAAKIEEPDLVNAQLVSTPRAPMWVLKSTSGRELFVDARTGDYFDNEISESDARRFATAAYQGPGKPVSVKYFDSPPVRSGTRDPAFEVSFDDPDKTRLYISSFDGETLSRRSALWDAYDLAWKLHILNFKDGDNYNHPTLLIVTILTVVVTFSGVVLLWIRIGRDLKGWAAMRKDYK